MKIPSDFKPDKVVRHGCLTDYRKQLHVLGDELTYLHSNLSLLNQIFEFDAELFEAPTALLQHLVDLFATQSVLIVQRTWKDKPRSSLTLDRFVKWVGENAVKPEFRTDLQSRIEVAMPPPTISESIERMRKIRHATIGHVNKNTVLGIVCPPTPVKFAEIRSAAEALGNLFNAVNFGSERLFVFVQFHTPDGHWSEGDLGYLLERIALGSKWFSPTLPERLLRDFMSELTAQQKSEIDRLREKYKPKQSHD